MEKLWALPPLQANRRDQQPSICSLPLHRSNFGASKQLAWYPWFVPKAMGGTRYPRMVVLVGGKTEPTPEGIVFTSFASRLGDLKAKERLSLPQ
jgi:hypothetical protein